MSDAAPSANEIDVAALIRRAARARSAHTAFVWEDGWLTYAELVQRVDALAASFAKVGVEPGDRVAFILRNGPTFIETYLATLTLGAICVPMNFRLASPEIEYMTGDAEPKLLIADEPALERIAGADLPGDCRLIVDGDENQYQAMVEDGRDEPPPRPPIASSDPASILYTSGTTGRPKGVVRNQSSICMMVPLRQAAMMIDADTALVATTPMFHAAGHEFMLLETLAAGGRVISRRAFDPSEVAALVDDERASHAFFVPTMSLHLVQAMRTAGTAWPSLKLWVSAAAPLPDAVRESVLAAAPSTQLWNCYGITEGGTVSYLRHSDIRRKSGTCVGQPAVAMEVRCVDENDNDVAQDEVGEILCRSPESMSGYWRRPRETAETLRGGWVHTGDLGAFDDEGYLSVLDRAKDMVLSGGENVYAAEVENALASAEVVHDVAVIGVPHSDWGEAVVAVVVAETSENDIERDLMNYTRHRLAGYKCPKRVVVIDALPRNSFGKVIKSELRERYAQLFAEDERAQAS